MISKEEQQQAMKELKHMISELKADTATFNHPLSRQLVHTLSVAVDCLEVALSQPERPKGRWVQEIHTGLIGDTNEYNDTYFFRCSICGRTVFEKEPYCHCGADMRGEEE